jgi:hypothetical protein
MRLLVPTSWELLEHAKTIKTLVDEYLASLTLENQLKSLASKFPMEDADSDMPNPNKR